MTAKDEKDEKSSESGQQQRRIVQRRPQSITRVITVDTSRSKSNAEVVRMCIQKLGWKDYPEGRQDNRPCDIYWHNLVYSDMKDVVLSGTKVNKFPGMNELSRKIHLSRSLGSMQRIYPDQFDFYPKSWFIPAQLQQFNEDYYSMLERGCSEVPWFIVKPDEGAQGCGIYLIHSPEQLQNLDQPQLIQKYIAQPYLLQKYRMPSTSNSDQVFMHLTNFSLNKTNSDYVHSNDLENQGSKRLLSTVFHQLESKGVNTRKVWHNIKLIIVKTVLAMVPELILHYENHFSGNNSVLQGPSCFHILGFDVLLTKDLQPILLEINACPSLTLSQEIKSGTEDKENRGMSKSTSTSSIPTPSRATSTTTSTTTKPRIPSSSSTRTSGDVSNNSKKPDTPPPRVSSVVDEAIKVPLVRDTLLLVTEQLPLKQSSAASLRSIHQQHSSDDSEAFVKQRPSLREIFPSRYSHSCGHLLILDRAAYLYMQFISIRRTLNITSGAFKTFIRKCQLGDIMNMIDVDDAFQRVIKNYTGQQLNDSIPFHGFIDLLIQLSRAKFPGAETPSEALKSLLVFCQSKLRHSGVRSARLRAETIDNGEAECSRQIYLLPNRIPGGRKTLAGSGNNSIPGGGGPTIFGGGGGANGKTTTTQAAANGNRSAFNSIYRVPYGNGNNNSMKQSSRLGSVSLPKIV